MAKESHVVGLFFLVLLMVLTFIPLNSEIQTIAAAEDATTLAQVIGLLFPYLWIAVITGLISGLLYIILKGRL